MLVGISGKKQSGKDTVANIWRLLDYYYNGDYQIIAKENALSDIDYVKFKLKEQDFHTVKTQWEIRNFADRLKKMVCLLTGCTMKQLEDEEFKQSKLSDDWIVWELKGSKYKSFVQIERELFLTEDELKATLVPGERNARLFNVEIKMIHMTFRELLQYLGTDLLRINLNPNIWINSLFSNYETPKFTWNPEKEGESIIEHRCISCNKFFDAPLKQNYCKECCENKKNKCFWLIPDVRFKNEAQAILDRKGIIIRVNRMRDLRNVNEHISEVDLDDYTLFKHHIYNNGDIDSLIKNVRFIMKMENIIYENDMPF